MKRFLIAVLVLAGLQAWAGPIIPNTAYTRDFLRSTNAAQAQVKLGGAFGSNAVALAVVTNVVDAEIAAKVGTAAYSNATAFLKTSAGGTATNSVFVQAGNSFATGAANFLSSSNNTDSSPLLIGAIGDSGAAIIGYTNSAGMQVDEGLWGPAFGAGFGSKFVVDLYNRATPVTNAIPGWQVRFSGNIPATGGWAGDAGFVTHHALDLDPTNGSFDIRMLNETSAIHVNLRSNGLEHLAPYDLTANSMPVETLAGTISGTSSATPTITGTGTAFLSHVSPGDVIFDQNGGTLFVQKTNSDTQLICAYLGGGNYSGSGLTATVQHHSFQSSGIGRIGYGAGVDQNGDLFILKSSGEIRFFFGSNGHLWSWSISSDGNARLCDWEAGGANPQVWHTGTPDSTLEGLSYGLSLRGMISNNAAAYLPFCVATPQRSTNAFTTTSLPLTNMHGIFLSNYVDVWIQANIAGTIKGLKLGTVQ
jgi:hypothetical protein